MVLKCAHRGTKNGEQNAKDRRIPEREALEEKALGRGGDFQMFHWHRVSRILAREGTRFCSEGLTRKGSEGGRIRFLGQRRR